jgi:hypothetical protein
LTIRRGAAGGAWVATLALPPDLLLGDADPPEILHILQAAARSRPSPRFSPQAVRPRATSTNCDGWLSCCPP